MQISVLQLSILLRRGTHDDDKLDVERDAPQVITRFSESVDSVANNNTRSNWNLTLKVRKKTRIKQQIRHHGLEVKILLAPDVPDGHYI
jgi:hypothetical protein